VARYIESGGDPDEAIRLANLDRPRKKQVKKETKADIQDMLPPAVFFQVPAERDVTVYEDSIRVKAVAKALTKEPITDIWLLVNGRRVEKGSGPV